MHELLEGLDDDEKGNLQATLQPDWMAPMLATLTERRFTDRDWIFEQKFDGERCLAFRREGRVRLLSRNRTRLNDTYPELAAACESVETGDFIADGEIVALDHGVSSFSMLQNRMQITDRERARQSGIPVFYYLFDLMYLDGYDITSVGLRYRKNILEHLFSYEDPLRFSRHRDEQGESCFEEACKRGWEGVIAKRALSRYVSRRSPDWMKFTCINRQEFVIGGFTDPAGGRTGFGALLIGYYDERNLVFAGKVGTGFDDRVLSALAVRLSSLKTARSPFTDRKKPLKGEHWVKPELVCEVAFTEWTNSGMLRHPRFLGLRDDKAAEEVGKGRGH